MANPYESNLDRYETAALERNRYGAPSAGWSQLGAAFAGGGGQQAAFAKGALQGGELQSTLALAKQRQIETSIAQQKLDSQTNLQQSLIAGGIPANQAQILASVFNAGHDKHQVGEYQNDQQKNAIFQAALQSAQNGTDSLTNRLLSVGEGKPMVLSAVQDNTILNPHAPPSEQSFPSSELGQAMIGAQGASVQERLAQAGAALALASKRGATVTGGIGNSAPVNQTIQTPTGRALMNFDGPQAAALKSALQGPIASGASDSELAQALTGNTMQPGPGQWAVSIDPKAAAAQTVKPAALTAENAKLAFTKPVLDSSGNPAVDNNGHPITTLDIPAAQDFQKFIGLRSGADPSLANQNAALAQYRSEFGEQNQAPPPGAMDLHDAMVAAANPQPSADPGLLQRFFTPNTPSAGAMPSQPPMPKTQADFDALPSGTVFINPADGRPLRKP